MIYQNYVGRVVGVAAAEDVGEMLEKLHVDGLPFILGADETVPDPSYGDEGQLAFKPTTGEWWMKSGGAWVPSAGLTALGYGGTSTSSVTIGLGTKVFTTQSLLAYNGAKVRAASAANQNNYMIGPATYSGTTLTMTCQETGGSGTFADWLFSVAGEKGTTGAQGIQGPAGPQGIQGPPGASGSGSGNVVGPTPPVVADRIAVWNGTTGTNIKDGGKTIAELAPLASPTFTGNPTAPTPTAGDNDTSIATTAFVLTALGATVRTVKVQTFTASGTYTPSAGLIAAIIECQAGGGGGGGAAAQAAAGQNGAGGGRAGSYSQINCDGCGCRRVAGRHGRHGRQSGCCGK